MRRITLFVATMMVGLLLASGVAWAVTLNGTNGSDTLWGTDRADFLKGMGGSDTVMGLAGSDVLSGGSGADYLFGGPGGDNLSAWAGDDVLFGGSGRDDLYGVQGADVMYGGPGNDDLFGKNILPTESKRDVLFCGKGIDRYGADKVDFVDSSCEVNAGYVVAINSPASASATASK